MLLPNIPSMIVLLNEQRNRMAFQSESILCEINYSEIR